MNDTTIHRLADVQSCEIGARTRIWQFVVVLSGARIGSDCNVCSHCFIENDVVIGDRVTIKNNVQLWDGLRVGDDVFIGPGVSFSNDRFPRSRQVPERFLITTIEEGASIGAGAVVLPGLVIGRNAMVGAGAVVVRSVPENAVVVGNPAKIVGYVDADRPQVVHAMSTSQDAGVTVTAVAGVTLHRLPRIADMRGSLVVGEFEREIPFHVKRYFITFEVPSREVRGEHAHHHCQEFLICIRGQCSVLTDDGVNRAEFLLDDPQQGVYLPAMVWRTHYKYSSDAMLLVFASEYYDGADYIRSYSDFCRLAKPPHDSIS